MGFFGAVALIAAAPALRVADAVLPGPPPPKPKLPSHEQKAFVVARYRVAIKAVPTVGLPPGTLTYCPADKPVPDGWILCDGREVPKGLYHGLENVLRTCGPVSFPYGDSVWSYNVPDFRGRAYT